MKSDFIWMDGEFVPYEKATIHFINPTLHYGPGVFEGIRCYSSAKGPAIFRLKDHLARFLESIHILGVSNFPYSIEDLSHAIIETVKVNKFESCYIRPLMYLDGPLGLNMDRSLPRVMIASWEWGPYLGEEAQKSGIHMMVSSYTRLHPNVNMTKAKISGNYVNSMMAKTLALRSGYDEAVILDPQGFVAECTGENVFMVREGKLYTPPLSTVLEGITRETITTLAGDMGIEVIEEMITRDLLYIADEVFIGGTAAEIVGVRMIDFRTIGGGKVGPITKELLRLYLENVHGAGAHSAEWLDFVREEEQ
ncbi:MAG: branched-chain amino acid transaminase [Anaerolineales bacterium]|nr:MAG: branched-chain amino acid transaminase [Anaerolineales bacterium]